MSSQGKESVTQVPRRKLFVDAKLQGALLAHTILYWFYCLLSVSVIAVAWIVLVKRPPTSADLSQQLWQNFGPALLGAVVLLPLVLLDCLRLSNRFAGPMVRIQRAMKQLATGERPEKLKVRKSDFWSEFIDDFNLVIDQSVPSQKPRENRPEGSPKPGAPLEPPRVSGANIYSDVLA